MPRQLNQRAGEILETKANSAGIKILKNARTKEILGDERVREILLNDGTTIPAELVVITTGVRSNSYVARLAGMTVDKGVVVDNHLKTSVQGIFLRICSAQRGAGAIPPARSDFSMPLFVRR